MKIGVISDTHGAVTLTKQVVQEMGHIDLLIHLGDYCEDGLAIKEALEIPMVIVKGNCDRGTQVKEEEIISVEDQKILLVHGHQYEVKRDLMRLYYRALELGCGIALYGHTHIPVNLRQQGILILNPGSIGHPRGGTRATYGILEILEHEIRSEIIEL